MAFSTTWGQALFSLVLRDSGVAGQGQTPNAQMASDAAVPLCKYDDLIPWVRRRWLVYHLVDTAHTCDGSLNYTVGPGGDFDIDRIDQIEAAYMRQTVQSQPNQVDYPLRLIHSYEDYSQITLKNMEAGPSWALFFDSSYPMGLAYPWPLANNSFELHLITKASLPVVGNLTDEILLPPEYIEPIYFNSIVRTRAAFRLPPDPAAVQSDWPRQVWKRFEEVQISRSRPMGMPAAVQGMARNLGGGGGGGGGGGAGAYNIFSDGQGPWRNRRFAIRGKPWGR